jgi:dGTPase
MSLDWNKLLSDKRLGIEDEDSSYQNVFRSQFQRDYDRIIFSSPFRRLQNKTQVFPLPGSIFVHNRLTHSLEVASVGRSLGTIVANKLRQEKVVEKEAFLDEIGSIVSAACLAHDLGNPPFGHSGEQAISNYFQKEGAELVKNIISPQEYSDLTNFEGNANTLRLLTNQFEGRRKGGFALTYSTLATIIKYPCNSTSIAQKNSPYEKYGVFNSEKNVFSKIANELGLLNQSIGNNQIYCRHPLVFLIEAADDICYQVVDLEDAHKLNIISTQQTKDLMLAFFDEQTDKKHLASIHKTLSQLTDENEQITILRSRVINKLIECCIEIFWEHYSDIMNGKMHKGLMYFLSGCQKKALEDIKTVAFQKIYSSREVIEIQVAGHKILGELLHEFISAILLDDSLYAKQLLKLRPPQLSPNKEDTAFTKIMSIVDFVSGMTDIYSLELYRKIKGISFSIIR